MESKKVFSNQSEYESWLNENKEKAMEYFIKNDIDLRDVSMNTRAYNALRISGKNKMSDIIFCSNSEIYNIEMMTELMQMKS